MKELHAVTLLTGLLKEVELEMRILELNSGDWVNSACTAQGIGTAFRETKVFNLSLPVWG